MESLVLFLFASAGATIIVVMSSIFDPIRGLFFIDEQTLEEISTNQIRRSFIHRMKKFFGTLIHCPLCFGFWMGAVMYLFLFGIESYDGFMHFAGACAASASSYLLYHTIKD